VVYKNYKTPVSGGDRHGVTGTEMRGWKITFKTEVFKVCNFIQIAFNFIMYLVRSFCTLKLQTFKTLKDPFKTFVPVNTFFQK